MTDAATVSRPALHLVPGSGRRRPSRPAHRVAPSTVPGVAAEHAARVLGTFFAPVATVLAERFARQAPLLARRGRPEGWAAAIAFLLAEESELFRYDSCTTRTSLARELGSTLPTLRRRVAELRIALGPLALELPDPDPDLDLRPSGIPAASGLRRSSAAGGGGCKM